jgi:hypothetical protein
MTAPTTINGPVHGGGAYNGLIRTTPFRNLAVLFDKIGEHVVR